MTAINTICYPVNLKAVSSLPFTMIWTSLNLTRLSSLRTEPHTWCSLHDLPLEDALIPTISMTTPVGCKPIACMTDCWRALNACFLLVSFVLHRTVCRNPMRKCKKDLGGRGGGGIQLWGLTNPQIMVVYSSFLLELCIL